MIDFNIAFDIIRIIKNDDAVELYYEIYKYMEHFDMRGIINNENTCAN